MTYTRPEPGQPVIIEAGGRQLELRYTLRVLKELDTQHGISVLKGQMFDTLQDPAKMVTVLYYGLKTKNTDITQEWVEDNFDASMILSLAPMLALATTGRWVDIEKTMNGNAGALPNAERPKETATGLTSGPSDVTTLAAPN